MHKPILRARAIELEWHGFLKAPVVVADTVDTAYHVAEVYRVRYESAAIWSE